jgi:hypothetical protein
VKPNPDGTPQTWAVIDPPHRGLQAAGGDGVAPKDHFIANSADTPEGSLLVRHNSGQVKAFTQDGKNNWTREIVFSGEGSVEFVANDEGPRNTGLIPLGLPQH